MGTLWSYHEEGDDYEVSSGRGKDKKVQGRRGGWDYTRERNFGSGNGGSGCAWVVLVGIATLIGGGYAVIEQVSRFV